MAVLSLSNLKKTWYYLQKNGMRSAYLAAMERLLDSRRAPYVYEPVSKDELQKQRASHVSDVRFSVVVPAYETKGEHLTALLDSLKAQTYPRWELIVADASPGGGVEAALFEWATLHGLPCQRDGAAGAEEVTACQSQRDGAARAEEMAASSSRSGGLTAGTQGGWQDRSIRYIKLSRNGGIAENTNAGIARASGDYIGLLDHDDLLAPEALYEFAKRIEEEKKKGEALQALYSDEDKCDSAAETFFEPHRKPDFNLDLLLSNNYICHFLVMESGLMKKLKLRSGFDGAQDYDLVLRAAAGKARFAHVPKVLYHWRCHDASTAANPRSKSYAYEAGKRALEDFCKKAGWKTTVSHLKHLGFYRVDYEEDIFMQRPEVGALAGPLPDRKRLVSGIYDESESMLFEGLKKGFSGTMHRAALQQDVYSADLRAMRVRKELEPLFSEAKQRIAGAEESEIRQESIAFGGQLKDEGYLIVWDPQA